MRDICNYCKVSSEGEHERDCICNPNYNKEHYMPIVNQWPFKCPICEGRGIVPGGFYESLGTSWTSDRISELCRACSGGIIWGPLKV